MSPMLRREFGLIWRVNFHIVAISYSATLGSLGKLVLPLRETKVTKAGEDLRSG